MTAWDKEPALVEGDIDDLLTMFAKKDADGKSPTDVDWTPTYNLNSAAAEGWRWKAAKASELISVDLDGERMSSNQIFEHCERMAKTYSRKNNASPTTSAQ